MGVILVNSFLLVFLGYQIFTTSKVSGLPFASIPSMPSLSLSEDLTNKEPSPVSDISNNDSETTSLGDFKLFISSPNVNIYSLSSQNSQRVATNNEDLSSPAIQNTKYITSPSAFLYLSTGSINSSYSIPISTPTPSSDQELNLNINIDSTANYKRDSRDTGPVLSQVPFLSYRLADYDSSITSLNSPMHSPQLSRSNSDLSYIIDSSCSSSKPVLLQNQPVSSITNNNCNSKELDSSTDAISDSVDATLPCTSARSNRQISFFNKPTSSITDDCLSNKESSPVFLTLKQLNNNQAAKFFNIDNLKASFSSSSCSVPSVNLLTDLNENDMDLIQSTSQLNTVDESINQSQETISSCNCPDNLQNICQNDNLFKNLNFRRNLGQVPIETNDAPNPCTQSDCNLVNSQNILPINANKGYFQNFRVGCEQLTNNNAPCTENLNKFGKPIQINVKNNMRPLSNTNNLVNLNQQETVQNLNNNNNQGCPQLQTLVSSNNIALIAPNNCINNPANDLMKQNICGNNLGCPQIIPTNNKMANNMITNNNQKFVSFPVQNQNCPQVISVPTNNNNILQTKSIYLTDDNNNNNCIENQNNNADISLTNQELQSEPVSANNLLIQPNFGSNNINNNVVLNQQRCSELLAIAQNNLMAMLNGKDKAEANNKKYNLGCPEIQPTSLVNNVQPRNIGICLPNNQYNIKMSILTPNITANSQPTSSETNNLQFSTIKLDSNCETSPGLDSSQSFLTLKDVSNVVPTATMKSLFVQSVSENNVGSSLKPNFANTLSSCNNDITVPSFPLVNSNPSSFIINPSGSFLSTELPYLNQPSIYYPNSFANNNLQTILTLLQSNINNNFQSSYNCIQNGFGNSLVSSNTIPIQSLPQVSFINRNPTQTFSIPISVPLPETFIPAVSNLPLVCTTPTPYTSIQPIITSSSVNPIMSAILPQTNNIVGTPGLYTSLNNLASTLTQNIISNLISKTVPVARLPSVNMVGPMFISASTPIDSSMCLDATEPLASFILTAPQTSLRYSFSDIPVACNEYLPPVGCHQFTPLLNSDLFASASEPDIFECSPFPLSDTDAFYPEISFLASKESCLPVAAPRVPTSTAMQQSSSVSRINNTGRDAIDIQRLIASLPQGG